MYTGDRQSDEARVYLFPIFSNDYRAAIGIVCAGFEFDDAGFDGQIACLGVVGDANGRLSSTKIADGNGR